MLRPSSIKIARSGLPSLIQQLQTNGLLNLFLFFHIHGCPLLGFTSKKGNWRAITWTLNHAVNTRSTLSMHGRHIYSSQNFFSSK